MTLASPPARTRVRCRRGFALVIVLGLVAITLGLSYTLMRSESFDHHVQRNQLRAGDARAAAQAGVTLALRKLHDPLSSNSWAGADTTFSGNCDPDGRQRYEVEFKTGDDRLTAASADWPEYPFRLTITSTGYATDPLNTSSLSAYRIRAVVQLVRKQRSIDARVKTKLVFPPTQPPDFNQGFFPHWNEIQKLRDLESNSYRPFGGTLFTSNQGPAAKPVKKYRLYPKGHEYKVPPLVELNVTSVAGYWQFPTGVYGRDMTENPLGLFRYWDTKVKLGSSTAIQGTILSGFSTTFDINIQGDDITLGGAVMPPLYGETPLQRWRLPAMMARGDTTVKYGTQPPIAGELVLVFNPTPAGDTTHVPDWSQLYVPLASDNDRLHWDVVSWAELPAN